MFPLIKLWLKPDKKPTFTIPALRVLWIEEKSVKLAETVCLHVKQNLAITFVNEHTLENCSAPTANLNKFIYENHLRRKKKAALDKTFSELFSQYENAKFLIYRDYNHLNPKLLNDLLLILLKTDN